MTQPKVSIIVPVYNSEKYIGKTIEKILNQSLNDLELILVNDGSTDNSKEILNSYAVKDKRIKIVHKENGGVSSARNRGISIANGEFLSFVDSDDIIDFDMCQVMYNKAISTNSDIVCSGFIEEDINGNILRSYTYPFSDKVLKGNEIKTTFINLLDKKLEVLGSPSMCTKIFKTSLIKDNNITIDENVTVGEDLCFNIKCFDKANVVSGVDKSFYHYMNINPNSIMRKLDDKTFTKFIEGRHWILKTLEDYNLSSVEYSKFEYSRNVGNLLQIIDYNLSQPGSVSQKYKLTKNILNSEDFINSLQCSSDKYLSKNLRLIKQLYKSKLDLAIFTILFTRSNLKK